jgi:hypothetical protein
MPTLPPDSTSFPGTFPDMFSAEDPGYRSFIVRLWEAPGLAEPLRRCEVEEIQSGVIAEPASLEEVLRLLRRVVEQEGGEHGEHGR